MPLFRGAAFLLPALFYLSLVSIHPYFRDSAEFITQGVFFDIAHPPGSPLYAFLAHFFSKIPVGTFALRINLLSVIAALSVHAAIFSLVLHFSDRRIKASACALLAALLPLTSTGFIRQALTSEVYMLSAALALWALYFGLSALQKNNHFYFRLTAFLQGLLCVSHVSGVFVIPGLLLISFFSPLKKEIPRALFFALLGLSLYAILPGQSSSTLPLNSGAPTTISRLISHLTAARQGLKTVATIPLSAPDTILTSLAKTFSTLNNWNHLAFVAFLFTAFFLFSRQRREMLLILNLATAYLLFFAGWDEDALLIPISLLTVSIGMLLNYVRPSWSVALVTLTLLGGSWPTLPKEQGWDLVARNAAERTLLALPPAALYVVEPSFFMSSYLYAVEGTRPDIDLIYQPRILFPAYFEPQPLTKWSPIATCNEANEPCYQQLASLVFFADETLRSFSYEPTFLLHDYFKQAASPLPNTSTMSVSRKPGDGTYSAFAATVLEQEKTDLALLQNEPFIAADGAHHLRLRLVAQASALSGNGDFQGALALFKAYCEALPCPSDFQRNQSALSNQINKLPAQN